MPLNTLRLNYAPSAHPNDRIVFIKPLPRGPTEASDYDTADTLLRAIAAQCLPIMKSHYLSVTTLEEHEPNPEFIGRNFNNGEIIQLVLRGKHGGWLPVNMIQMVMMHELAHNMHMNHGRDFWKTRNLFADEMRALWARGFTGEGFWGGGRTLKELGDVMGGQVLRSEELKDLPVCGGTFRSRGGRKRKAKNDGLTWKEKQQRRIEKKFGKNGLALGEDEDVRLSLELSGKGPVGVKPRVAKSKRGRELRAAAALARFDTNKKEVLGLESMKEEEDETQSEDGDEYEEGDVGLEDAKDINGTRLLDSRGQGMIKVCEDEDRDDMYVKQELEELEGLDDKAFMTINNNSDTGMQSGRHTPAPTPKPQPTSLYDIPQHRNSPPSTSPPPNILSRAAKSTKDAPGSKASIKIHKLGTTPATNPDHSSSSPNSSSTLSVPTANHDTTNRPIPPQPRPSSITTCPICSLENPPLHVTCLACSHVLDRRKDPRAWKCASVTCKNSEYTNAGDMGICGVCGGRREERN